MEWNEKILKFRFILLPLALFYRATIFWRNVLYNYKFFISRKLPTRIISVGNITTGGTGKTPAVIYLAQKLLQKGTTVAILSRGYGRKTAGTQLVTDGEKSVDDWRNFGDEATLMAQKLKSVPIVVDENRYRGGLFLIDKFKPDIIILDDGFQHRSLERNCDIVLLNSQDQPADHKMIPYGNLREPCRHLTRADALILTKTNLTGIDLSGKDLSETILTGANLSYANLTGVDLSGKDLTGTILTGANLLLTNLEGANLTNAYLDDAILTCMGHSICN